MENIKVKKFLSSNGLEIIVGQDDYSNDQLSLKIAAANDLWFHTAGTPGSHVLLRCAETGSNKDSIREAAGLAAYFSKMRKGGKVPVHYCLAQHVSKPRGAKAGTVSIRREKKILVKPSLLEETD